MSVFHCAQCHPIDHFNAEEHLCAARCIRPTVNTSIYLLQVDGLRKEVEHLLLRKIEDPGLVLGQNRVVEAMLRLLSHDGF